MLDATGSSSPNLSGKASGALPDDLIVIATTTQLGLFVGEDVILRRSAGEAGAGSREERRPRQQGGGKYSHAPADRSQRASAWYGPCHSAAGGAAPTMALIDSPQREKRRRRSKRRTCRRGGLVITASIGWTTRITSLADPHDAAGGATSASKEESGWDGDDSSPRPAGAVFTSAPARSLAQAPCTSRWPGRVGGPCRGTQAARSGSGRTTC